MVQVTGKAATGLAAVIEAEAAPGGSAVRLQPDGAGGIAFAIAAPGFGDEVVRAGGAPILIVDASLVEPLQSSVLDLRMDGEDGPEFTLTELEDAVGGDGTP